VAIKGTQTEEPDDGARGASGVAVSIVEREGGRARLVFDDITRTGTAAPFQWNSEWFFTRVEFELVDLLEGQLDDKDYANIGHAIVARLAAHHKTRSRLTGR
jgi:hypothetical protein